jgi:hypothetical protein
MVHPLQRVLICKITRLTVESRSLPFLSNRRGSRDELRLVQVLFEVDALTSRADHFGIVGDGSIVFFAGRFGFGSQFAFGAFFGFAFFGFRRVFFAVPLATEALGDVRNDKKELGSVRTVSPPGAELVFFSDMRAVWGGFLSELKVKELSFWIILQQGLAAAGSHAHDSSTCALDLIKKIQDIEKQ